MVSNKKFGVFCLNCISGTVVMPKGNAHRIWSSSSWYGLVLRVHTSLLVHEVVFPLTLFEQTLTGARPVRQFHIPAENPNLYTEVHTVSLPSSLFLGMPKRFTRAGQAQRVVSSTCFSWEVGSMSIRQGKKLNLDLYLVVTIPNQWPTEWGEDGI